MNVAEKIIRRMNFSVSRKKGETAQRIVKDIIVVSN